MKRRKSRRNRRSTRINRRRYEWAKPTFERLEDRRLLAIVTVGTTADILDGDTSSITNLIGSPGPDGAISLREAISAANNTAGADTVNVPGGTYTLTIAGTLEDVNATGDLDATDAAGLVVQGDGQATTIIQAGANPNLSDSVDRVFDVKANAKFNLNDVTVRHGRFISGGVQFFGGAISVVQATATISNSTISDSEHDLFGGGIYVNAADVTIDNSTVTNNVSGSLGGGIVSTGAATLKITNSSVHNNQAVHGGGIYSNGGTVSIANSTLSNNVAGNGGAFRPTAGITVTITNSTVVENVSTSPGGGLRIGTPNVTLNNTIVAGNEASGSPSDISGNVVASSSNNLIGDATSAGGLSDGANNNIVGNNGAGTINPVTVFGTLTDNGGPTLSHALVANSPAIDAGNDSLAVDPSSNPLTTDQRGVGFDRIINGGTSLTVDIGAVEFGTAGPPPATIIDNGDAGYADTGFAYWPATSTPVQGHEDDVHFSAAGSGDMATWTFTGLTSGQYRVSATWFEHANRATNAPFTVMDGSLALGTVAVNQELAPTADVTEGTTDFQDLGTFDINGDTVVVKLSDNANDYVIADAIRIERTGDLPASSPEIEVYKSAGAATIIDNRGPGLTYSRTGSWTDWNVSGHGGDSDFAIGTGGSAVATSTFSGLTAGTYRVSATWEEHPNRATDAPFTVKDGVATLSTVDVNQELAPDDFSDAGSVWEDLGIFTITGTELIVELSDDADQYVIADGVRIERLMEVSDGDTVALGTAAALSQTFLVHNTGNDPLVLTEPITAAGDASPGSFGTTNLTTGQTTSVNVSLTGSSGGSIAIANNDADENPFDISLTGTLSGGGPPPFVAVIDNGDAGFNAGGMVYWPIGSAPAQGHLGDVNYSIFPTSGGRTATWNFTGLTPGVYRVSATWSEFSNRATDAPFSIDGGSAILVNQELAPAADAVEGGSNFQDLSVSHTVTGTTLTVSLTDVGANQYVIADAIRIERLSPLMAAGAQPPSSERGVIERGVDQLSMAAVDRLYDTAVAHWSLTDPSAAARLANVEVRVADLSGSLLGLASEVTNTIWLDSNAAGYGWQISQESSVQSRGAVDLQHVLTHELGHVLGHDDLDPLTNSHDIMAGNLATGGQRVSAGELNVMSPAVDRLFADFGTQATQEKESFDFEDGPSRFDTRLTLTSDGSTIDADREAAAVSLVDERDDEQALDELFGDLDELAWL
jgi:hypothetical protein